MQPPLNDPYKIRKASDFSDDYKLVKSAGHFQKILDVYSSNMERVRKLASLPIFLTAAATFNEANRVAAIYESNLKLGDPRLSVGHVEFDVYLWDAVNTLRIKSSNELIKSKGGEASLWLRSMGEFGLIALLPNHAPLGEGLSAILSAMIVDSWTAFEVLSDMLWETSLSIKPDLISHLTAKQKKEEIGSSSLKKIRSSFSHAFSTNGADIITSIDSTDIDALALVRNSIVHDSGVADKRFVDNWKIKNLKAPFDHIVKSDPLILDGEIVYNLIHPCVSHGCKFLTAVEGWFI